MPSNKKLIYIPLFENTGIARALNIGCEKALSDGFSWGMTMVQDSFWNLNQLKNYITEIQMSV